MTILEALDDPQLFAPAFRDARTWGAWRAFLAALFALPLDPAARRLYTRHTGRTTPPTAPAREAWVIVGRRGGKSRIAALVAVYLAAFRSYAAVLAPGEKATVAVIAADRPQARVVFRYIAGLLDAVPMLARLVTRRTETSLELRGHVVIEVHTCSFRSTRGYAFAAVIADEVAFWRSEDSAAPDTEVIAAVRPGLATIPGSLLLGISSPYARRGVLWQAFADHYGRETDPVLVWTAPSRVMNPTLDGALVAAAYAADPVAAAAEYGAEFRRDLERYLAREVLEAVTVPGRAVLPPLPHTRYVAFVDPSGGAADAFTLAIAHGERRGETAVAVLDLVAARHPPFNPEAVVREFVALLAPYGCRSVTGDRYAGEWPREAFARHGVHYALAAQPKSALYAAVLPLLTSGRVELLDDRRLQAQLLGLERRTARGGRDTIDHGPRGHDDLANAACGALLLAAEGSGSGEIAGANLAPVPYRAVDYARELGDL